MPFLLCRRKKTRRFCYGFFIYIVLSLMYIQSCLHTRFLLKASQNSEGSSLPWVPGRADRSVGARGDLGRAGRWCHWLAGQEKGSAICEAYACRAGLFLSLPQARLRRSGTGETPLCCQPGSEPTTKLCPLCPRASVVARGAGILAGLSQC